jgi:hypothetical protein
MNQPAKWQRQRAHRAQIDLVALAEDRLAALVERWRAAGRGIVPAGAIADEFAMLLRGDADERRKLDIFRRIEASNKLLSLQGMQREDVVQPTVDRLFYRIAYQLGLRFGEGNWTRSSIASRRRFIRKCLNNTSPKRK